MSSINVSPHSLKNNPIFDSGLTQNHRDLVNCETNPRKHLDVNTFTISIPQPHLRPYPPIIIPVKGQPTNRNHGYGEAEEDATVGENCGKGTPRRKVKKVHKTGGIDDKKLQTALKKLNVQPIQAIEEVNMFKADGNVIHFAAPKVHAAVPSNTFAIYGNGEDKELTELVPGILNQLGPDSLASLRKLAESYQSMQKAEGGDDKKDDDDDDDIPELVAGENFEDKVE
ncbi:hypothetical protein LZ554_000908 [Drepanopeziza brunnea f. sp. 'monogermtubi']|nr:hypothetical protein LZ554_000908 [Drepanopeziza brunnea f. sp. 'monogermtubi']